jgi:4-amino-4-deoxy-L-arabinose transferase-like glycosyltransferase
LRRSLPILLPLALYIASAYRDVMYWDVGEMDTVPYILGIAHPPGMPLYTLLGFAFSHLIPLGSVAFRMSLLSAIAVALACGVLAALVRDETGDDAAALVAALLFACGTAVWAHATRAEPHALALLAFALIARHLLRWVREGRARDWYILALAFGAGVAVHPVIACTLPGILAAIVVRAYDELDYAVLLRGTAAALALVAVCYAYLPLRSGWIDAHHAEPLASLGITGAAFWNYDDPSTAQGFAALVTGSDVAVDGVAFGATDATFVRGLIALAKLTATEWTLPGCALVAAGLVLFARRSTTRITLAALTLVPAALFGCAFAAESDVQRYWLPWFLLCALAVGIACASARRFRAPLLVLCAALSVVLVVQQREFFHQPFDRRARDEAAEILRATPPNAIVVATWVIAPPLAYDAYVEHAAAQRAIVADWYGNVVDELPGWAARRPVFVAGTPEGSVDGYHLERLRTTTELYRVVRDSTQP